MYPEKYIHTRIVYSYLDLISDLGGAFEMLFYLGSIIASPIATHLFIISASEKLCKVKSLDKELNIDDK